MTMLYGAASVTVRYQEFGHTERRSGRCPTCGKRRNRQRTFTMTQSPYNKDPETGHPRTVRQIGDALRELGRAWQPSFTCETHQDEEQP